MSNAPHINQLFEALTGSALPGSPAGIRVVSPLDGASLAQVEADTPATLHENIMRAKAAQAAWAAQPRADRETLLQAFSAALTGQRTSLAELITLDAGKTPKEALAEVGSSADIIRKTIVDATLPPLNGMARRKERLPVGIVGLITSFNFPLVVACWTIAPALLAGNAVIWKPSEKTLLAALAAKALFDRVAGGYRDVLQLALGERAIGAALVAHEAVDMISATGSVAMGEGIKATLAKKTNNAVKPILELGGNNGVIFSDKTTPEYLAWSCAALLNSFLGTSGQRCTNTRRLIVQRRVYPQVVERLQQSLAEFIGSGAIQSPENAYGYGPLIDEDAYRRFEQAKQQTVAEGGEFRFGRRVLAEAWPNAYYVEPALALLPAQTPIMHQEIFAPLLFIAPYDGEIDEAIAQINAPANTGLVNGLYTLSQREADRFAALNEAGHSVINSPKGTGTPAFGMGFGGNKESGTGEILNAADPLRAFTYEGRFVRVAQYAEVTMVMD